VLFGVADYVPALMEYVKRYDIALNFGFKGRDYKVKGEAAVWDRPGLKISTERRSGMTALTIESPSEGETATLVGIGVKDDPVSQELIAVLQGAAPTRS